MSRFNPEYMPDDDTQAVKVHAIKTEPQMNGHVEQPFYDALIKCDYVEAQRIFRALIPVKDAFMSPERFVKAGVKCGLRSSTADE